jgi:hypothetical protein
MQDFLLNLSDIHVIQLTLVKSVNNNTMTILGQSIILSILGEILK